MPRSKTPKGREPIDNSARNFDGLGGLLDGAGKNIISGEEGESIENPPRPTKRSVRLNEIDYTTPGSR